MISPPARGLLAVAVLGLVLAAPTAVRAQDSPSASPFGPLAPAASNETRPQPPPTPPMPLPARPAAEDQMLEMPGLAALVMIEILMLAGIGVAIARDGGTGPSGRRGRRARRARPRRSAA